MQRVFRLFLAAALLAGAAHSQTIRLRSGDILVGSVTEATSQGLVFRRADTGGVLELRWDHLSPESAEATRRAQGLVVPSDEEVMVPAVRVLYGAGLTEEEIIGKPVGLEGNHRLIRTRGRVVPVPTTSIRRLEEVNVPALEVYLPDEFYALKVAEIAPGQDPRRHLELALVLSRVRDYDRAIEHLSKARELGVPEQEDVVRGLLADMELRRLHRREADMLAEIDVYRNRGDFRRAQEVVERFAAEFPNSRLWNEFLERKRRLERDRQEALVREVTRTWYETMRAVAGEKARDRSLSLEAARIFCMEQMGQEIRNRIARRLDVTPEEAGAFFTRRRQEGRTLGSVQSSAYGSGTWLLSEREILERTAQAREEEGRRPAQGADPGAGGMDEVLRRRIQEMLRRQQAGAAGRRGTGDGLLTEEQWWEGAETSERQSWLIAYYAEKGGEMEVTAAHLDNCPICGARGRLDELDPVSGQTVSRTCPFCHGKRWLRRIRFR